MSCMLFKLAVMMISRTVHVSSLARQHVAGPPHPPLWMIVAVRLVSVTEVKCTGRLSDKRRLDDSVTSLLSSLDLLTECSWCIAENLL
jgi:hypothetical protein